MLLAFSPHLNGLVCVSLGALLLQMVILVALLSLLILVAPPLIPLFLIHFEIIVDMASLKILLLILRLLLKGDGITLLSLMNHSTNTPTVKIVWETKLCMLFSYCLQLSIASHKVIAPKGIIKNNIFGSFHQENSLCMEGTQIYQVCIYRLKTEVNVFHPHLDETQNQIEKTYKEKMKTKGPPKILNHITIYNHL